MLWDTPLQGQGSFFTNRSKPIFITSHLFTQRLVVLLVQAYQLDIVNYRVFCNDRLLLSHSFNYTVNIQCFPIVGGGMGGNHTEEVHII